MAREGCSGTALPEKLGTPGVLRGATVERKCGS